MKGLKKALAWRAVPHMSRDSKELGIERVTLYRYVGPKGELRDYGQRVLGVKTG
jgi:hypothetical protein